MLEMLERSKYGENGEPFHFWLFTSFVGSIVNMIVAYAALKFSSDKAKDVVSPPHPLKFALIAFCQSVASGELRGL